MAHLRLFWLTALALACVSCSSTIYQVAEARYTGKQATEAPHIIDHGDLRLAYNFWTQDGLMGCTITNQTQGPLVLDLTQSSVVFDGQTQPYFEREEFQFSSRAINFVRWYGTTKGSGQAQKRTGRLLLPPGAHFTLEEIPIAYPFLSPEQLNDVSAWKDSVDIQAPAFHFRHYLAYFSPQTPDEVTYLDDPFEVQQLHGLSRSRFQARESAPLAFYARQRDLDAAGPVLIAGVLFGLVLVIMAGNG